MPADPMPTFAAHLARTLGVSEEEALYALDGFVRSLRERAATQGYVTYPGLGTFQHDDEGLAFTPDETFALLVNHRFAGLEPLPLGDEVPEPPSGAIEVPSTDIDEAPAEGWEPPFLAAPAEPSSPEQESEAGIGETPEEKAEAGAEASDEASVLSGEAEAEAPDTYSQPPTDSPITAYDEELPFPALTSDDEFAALRQQLGWVEGPESTAEAAPDDPRDFPEQEEIAASGTSDLGAPEEPNPAPPAEPEEDALPTPTIPTLTVPSTYNGEPPVEERTDAEGETADPGYLPPRVHRYAEPAPPPPRRSVLPIVLGGLAGLLIFALVFFALNRTQSPAGTAPRTVPPSPPPVADTTGSAAGDTLTTPSELAAQDADEAPETSPPATPPSPPPATPPTAEATPPARVEPALRGTEPVTEGSGWTIVVGGAPSEGAAESIAARYRNEGYRVGVLPGRTSAGALVYRVGVGQLGSQREAQQVLSRMRGRALPADSWILSLR